MANFILLALLLGITLMGCITNPDMPIPEPRQVPADSIAAIKIDGRTLTFTVICTALETCWIFVGSEHTHEGSIYTTRIFARRVSADAICGPALWPVVTYPAITVPSIGTYTFRFLRGDSATIDTTLTIP